VRRCVGPCAGSGLISWGGGTQPDTPNTPSQTHLSPHPTDRPTHWRTSGDPTPTQMAPVLHPTPYPKPNSPPFKIDRPTHWFSDPHTSAPLATPLPTQMAPVLHPDGNSGTPPARCILVTMGVKKRVKCLSSTCALGQNQITTLVLKNIIYSTCGY
jgi:hypothetical protein